MVCDDLVFAPASDPNSAAQAHFAPALPTRAGWRPAGLKPAKVLLPMVFLLVVIGLAVPAGLRMRSITNTFVMECAIT